MHLHLKRGQWVDLTGTESRTASESRKRQCSELQVLGRHQRVLEWHGLEQQPHLSSVFHKSGLRASCGNHGGFLRIPWSHSGLYFTVREGGLEKLPHPRGPSWCQQGPVWNSWAPPLIGHFMASPHRLPRTEHLSCPWQTRRHASVLITFTSCPCSALWSILKPKAQWSASLAAWL